MSGPYGVPIVLTADRTLTADYDLLLDGMMACSQTTTTPRPVMDLLLMPRATPVDGRARWAPLGVRRIEAALAAEGIPRDEVAVVDDAHLHEVVGPGTKVIGIGSGEPLGIGMSSTTMAGAMGGVIYPQHEFRKLMARVTELTAARCPGAKVVMGGPGAWQLAQRPERIATTGIDHVVVGYAEGNAGSVFADLLAGRPLPQCIEGLGARAVDIPPVLGATTMGVVEISRGCGLGCDFCTIAGVRMEHLPLATVLSDAETNLRAGMTSLSVLSEDLFRYGSNGVTPTPAALLGLLQAMRELPGLRLLQADHVNLSSIAAYSDEELAEVRRLLSGDTGARRPWLNVGVETASGQLLVALGGRAKMGGVAPEDWGQFSREQIVRLCRAGFVPMVSLLLGSPQERREDTLASLRWVQSLVKAPVTVFPVLYAAVDGGEGAAPEQLTKAQWDLMRAAYEMNFRWVPRLYWDNQGGAGVGLGKRLALQILGRGQVPLWRISIARHRWSAPE